MVGGSGKMKSKLFWLIWWLWTMTLVSMFYVTSCKTTNYKGGWNHIDQAALEYINE